MSENPRKLTAAQRQEVRDFMEWLIERSGRSQSQLAADAGLLASTVSDYKRGVNGPGFFSLLKLMRAAGVLDIQAPVAGLTIGARLESLEAQVSTLARWNETFAEDVFDRLDQLQAVRTRRPPPQRKVN